MSKLGAFPEVITLDFWAWVWKGKKLLKSVICLLGDTKYITKTNNKLYL